jgi:hypothetical protein
VGAVDAVEAAKAVEAVVAVEATRGSKKRAAVLITVDLARYEAMSTEELSELLKQRKGAARL